MKAGRIGTGFGRLINSGYHLSRLPSHSVSYLIPTCCPTTLLPLPLPLPLLRKHLGKWNPTFRFLSSSSSSSSSMAMGEEGTVTPIDGALETQFESFRLQLDDSTSLRDRLRNVAIQLDSASRIMHANLLLVHQSRPLTDVLEKAKSQIQVMRGLYSQLADILRDCPGHYYRYHNEWRSETQTVVSLLAFMHWLETGTLLLHPHAQEMLALTSPDFGLDIEDYLVGICFMSNELPRYVVNRVTYGDYDCPRKVLNFITDLHAAYRMLNLRNDFLRKKFDGMKYDLKRVEEVYYDVKIRGLAHNGDTKEDQGVQGQA